MLNVSDTDGVRVVELDHGKVNALDLELLQALTDAFAGGAPHQPIVVTGAGRAFSAGVDLKRICAGDAAYTADYLAALVDCFLAVLDHPGPVVAAINGPAIAGGYVIAAACDRRLISRGPVGLAELAVGVPFPTSAIEISRSLLGNRAHDLVLTGRVVQADEALALGMVDELVADPHELLPRAIAHASTFGALPEGVFAFTKRQLQRDTRQRIAAHRDEDAEVLRMWQSDSVRASIAVYLQQLSAERA